MELVPIHVNARGNYCRGSGQRVGRWYKHVVAMSRRHATTFGKLADEVAPRSSENGYKPAWHAEYAYQNLRHIARFGLPDCYKTFEESLADFWPDLPWTADGFNATCDLLIADPRMEEVCKQIKLTWGFDFHEELIKARAEGQAIADELQEGPDPKFNKTRR
jgi:hypothetical protein